nr:hypothetical protein [Tanacetum cinerariifolium]
KKAPAITDRSKGIDLLSKAALFKEAQVKKVLKRSRRETTIHQACGTNKESKDAFIHTPEDYVPTDDETNDETNNVDEEEYERIKEEMYGDVNVRLTDTKHNDEEKGDAKTTDATHVQVEQA